MRSQKLGFLSRLLCKWPPQSSLIGKSMLPVLLLVRLVILGAAAHTAWGDDDKFECNSRMPGCKEVCYDQLTPLAATRLWTLQLLLVLSPGLVFHCYLLHLINQENQVKKADGKVKGHALGMYQACMVSVILIEVVFVLIQSLLYGFWVRVNYSCSRFPCSHHVDCFVPRSGQKTSFLFIMFITSCVSLLLSAVELICVMVRNRQQHGADVVQSGSEVTEDPSFLEQLLSLWHCHSSLLGKTSLPVLQLIRVVMVGAAVQPVWDKEFTGFVCDTQQPGCTHAAFSHIFSLSLHQYWTLQVVLILAPGLIFLCYLVHVIMQNKKCDQ
ncbi:gap junction Cx32.2 protein-like isoform X1 [Betta splendens]|uniref:Gap junction Cx32.2 protein-like isoform X1 n=1 Tax=Betta splendens TaxID=158456 RepID=A0A6P7LEC6_BETSP|nr:gap junction Cx32.2 protein-like isoform X1 [Betta splendens]XP_040925708.1 gap junction Cx32.2 protein-like isoform X1 [Betta splendens]